MKVALVRIDERLVHGQITMGWVRVTSANLILAVNDTVAKDPFQTSLMKMAAPPGVDIEIASVADAVAGLLGDRWRGKTVLLLVRTPIDLVRLVELGLEINKVNVGGVRSPQAKVKLTKEVSATPEEMEAWKKMDELGIRIEVQWLPGQGVTVLNDIIKKQAS